MSKQESKISDKVISKIKKEDVKPIPKWHFVLEHGLLWLLLLFLIVGGGMLLGIAYLELNDAQWDLRPVVGKEWFGFVLAVFPYFWLFLFGVVAVLAYYNFVNTPKGYRYPKYQIIVFGLLIIILTAIGFHFLGFVKNSRDFLRDQTPLWERLHLDQEKIYHAPEKGIIVGKVIGAKENILEIEHLDGSRWKVDIGQLEQEFEFIPGQKVIVVGRMLKEGEFEAKKIRALRKGEPLRLGHDIDKLKGGPPPLNNVK
ncbi:hypothetical protein KJ855_00530 [Patescibacteria group bacterium]|nr:hypothetical protein [Patescibacteria group bacterium]